MSKYEKLWQYVKNRAEDEITLTFDEIEKIVGFPLDHSFLRYKKEAAEYGFKVEKIFMKEQKIAFFATDTKTKGI